MRDPNFLIIGSPKSGTTALAQFLGDHPDIFISEPKEPHFFDAHYVEGMDTYVREHFKGRRHEALAGEATPSYLLIPFAAQRIRLHLPSARLIAILRHPVDRAYSSWWMFHARGMEPLTFEEAIRENERRLANGSFSWDGDAEALWRSHVNALRNGSRIRLRTYLDTGYYAIHLKRYYDLFPAEQVKVVFSEDLQLHPGRVVRELFSFLGADDGVQVAESEIVNAALGPGSRRILEAARLLGIMRLRSLLPTSTRGWIKDNLSRLGKRAPIDPSTRAYLLDHFSSHVRDLEELLHVDLQNWRQ